MQREHNWSDNYTYRAARIHRPDTIAEISRLVRSVGKIRAIATRHSFNAIADTDGDLLDLRGLSSEPEIDREQRTASVAAGTPYGMLARALQTQGYALHNMGSLPHISVAGAISTGTHGSGDKNANLSSAVAALEFVTATGDLIQVRRGDDSFNGMVIGLGAFGIITRVTLDIQPSFDIRQDAFAGLPWATVLANLERVMGAAYSVSIMTRWSGDTADRLWLKTRLSDGLPLEVTAEHLGAKASAHASASGRDHVGTGLTQFGVPGPWSELLCHFRPDCEPGEVAQIQSEYMIPRDRAITAITRLRAIGDRIDRCLLMGEIRTMAADELWLSPSYGHDTVGLHFTWKREAGAVDEITAEMEELLLPLGARPHWGKLIHAPAGRLAPLYPRMAEFRALADVHDPGGKFRNAFLDYHVFGS